MTAAAGPQESAERNPAIVDDFLRIVDGFLLRHAGRMPRTMRPVALDRLSRALGRQILQGPF